MLKGVQWGPGMGAPGSVLKVPLAVAPCRTTLDGGGGAEERGICVSRDEEEARTTFGAGKGIV